ncbi:plasmid mobilization relaxosome protein MobC [Streptococcus porci]|uniref:plasmid mobilization relaxosome protein MobC n=1 Tax=Streptococcus porci TaxID=502567 RepID=UPI0003F97276|nr:plasmid mobilization relaxosome protein MobC [Streptococcus porci]
MEELNKRSMMTDEQYFGIISEISKLSEKVGLIETDLHKIGININQIARYYNSKNDDQSVSALNGFLSDLRKSLSFIKKYILVKMIIRLLILLMTLKRLLMKVFIYMSYILEN